ncbi:PDZ and LIM domain protein 2-like [Sinocyclocheilus rhinocerous]|uniref:PDZ and LIM domain protein 2-like n=1 Tax=Sinocyclocheilus rhinocerous TaxID=307959 RepID=UPI0007BAB2A1|nr:PREDICTED: PDZ and LIM domain protein 2-like [Sinocyclocheilus rhinocerous]
MTFRLSLTGPPPWGFRICGGRDFRRSLTVSKVCEDSRAGDAGMQVGDVILEINGQDTGAMLNMEAQNKIKTSEHQLWLLIERPAKTDVIQCCGDPRLPVHSEPSVRPKQTHESGQGQSKRAPQERNYGPEQLKQHDKESTAGHNSASDYIQTVSYESQTTKKKVSFNYPVWSYGPVDPEELMRIKRRQVQPQQPRQSNTFRILQEGLERTSLPSGAVQRSQRFRTCERCGYIIVTQVVKIRERRYRHVECYTCRDCGFSLMERGHFCVDEELYCGKHAQQRCQTANGLHSPLSP